MNLPFAGVWFASYESMCKVLYSRPRAADESHYEPTAHLLAGAFAGAVASAFTTPFDVAKTRLQTQGDVSKKYVGMTDAMRTIWHEEGLVGYTRGMRPRMLFHATSGAVCWSVYEYAKRIIGD